MWDFSVFGSLVFFVCVFNFVLNFLNFAVRHAQRESMGGLEVHSNPDSPITHHPDNSSAENYFRKMPY